MSIGPSAYLSLFICLYVPLVLCPFVSVSLLLSVHLSLCPSCSLSISSWPSVYLTIISSIHTSIRLSVNLSACPVMYHLNQRKKEKDNTCHIIGLSDCTILVVRLSDWLFSLPVRRTLCLVCLTVYLFDMSIQHSARLSVFLFYLSISVSDFLPDCPPVHLCIHPSVLSLLAWMFVCLSVRLFVWLFVYLFVRLYVSLSYRSINPNA
jgi:hypothetical protein